MSGAVGGAIKNTLGASSSANVGKAIAAAAATVSSVATPNPAHCDKAAVGYSVRNVPSTEDDWMFVGDMREEEIQHGISILRKVIPENKALSLEAISAPPEDSRSVSSEDTDSIEASRIIEQTEEEIVYGRPKEKVSIPETDEWFSFEKIVFAAVSDPKVQKSIMQSDNVREILRQLRSGPQAIEFGQNTNLLPGIARAAQPTVTKTEEEKSPFEGLMDKIKDSMSTVAQAAVSGFKSIKEKILNMFERPGKDTTTKERESSDDGGVGMAVIAAVTFVVLVVLLGRAGFRVRPSRL